MPIPQQHRDVHTIHLPGYPPIVLQVLPPGQSVPPAQGLGLMPEVDMNPLLATLRQMLPSSAPTFSEASTQTDPANVSAVPVSAVATQTTNQGDNAESQTVSPGDPPSTVLLSQNLDSVPDRHVFQCPRPLVRLNGPTTDLTFETSCLIQPLSARTGMIRIILF